MSVNDYDVEESSIAAYVQSALSNTENKKVKRIKEVQDTVKTCVNSVISYIEREYEKHSKKFDKHQLGDLYRKCDLGQYQPDLSKVVFLKAFQVKVYMRVFNYAMIVLDNMQDRYETQNSIKHRVQKEKEVI